MDAEESKSVNVLFRYFSHVLDEEVVEILLSTVVDEKKGIYRLDSIPGYGPMIATDDEFLAEYDKEEEHLTYRETVNPSGNSIVVVILLEEDVKMLQRLRKEMTKLGCRTERLNDSYFSVQIPYDVDYQPIQERLQQLEDDEVLSYAEPCLSDKHAEDLETE